MRVKNLFNAYLWRGLFLACIILINIATSPAVAETAPDAAYRDAFEKWKTELAEDLKQNWLPLAGLFWLKPGSHTFGSDATNEVVLPNLPTHAGVFEFNGQVVTVRVSPGVKALVNGTPVTVAELQSDGTGHPAVLEIGSLRMHVIQRGERIGIRVKDLKSPAVQKFKGNIFFPLNIDYRITATWVPSDGKKTVDVPNVLGDVTHTPVTGEVRFRLNGKEVSLTDLGGDPTKGLFFVFNDLTSKTDTYPGGRFLETDPVVNSTVVLDFNRAHNPPCAVTPYATCPLAPRENRLEVTIAAGEKYDHSHSHQ